VKAIPNKLKWIIAIIILAWPLFFLNITNQLDWGDDNSKYLEQAQQIAEGKFELKTNYLFNAKYFLGPKFYPNGYPLLLATWSKIAGFSVLSFNYLNVWLLIIAGIFVFLFATKFFSNLNAFVICLVFLYHPGIMQIKLDVLSELPFLAGALAILWWLPKMQMRYSIIGGLLLGYLVHVRVVGFCLLIVYLIHYFTLYRETNEKIVRLRLIKQIGIYFFCFLLTYFSIKIVFPVSSNYHFFQFDYNVLLTTLRHLGDNFHYYTEPFFGLKNRELQFISLLTGAGFLFASFYGWLLALLRKDAYRYLHYYTVVYLLVICFFKHGDAGFRFLIPIFPFLLIYASIALKQWLIPFAFLKAIIWKPILLLLLLVQFMVQYPMAPFSYTQKVTGPNEASAQGLFEFLKRNTKYSDEIAFSKPRALSYFTNRKSLIIGPLSSTYELLRKANKFRFEYYVFYWDLNRPHDLKVINSDKIHWKQIYINKKAIVFKRMK
jgi:hypothetical protein